MTKRANRFSMERLEDRRMMAADVIATYSNGTLFLTDGGGTTGAQAVQVSQMPDGRFHVVGGSGADGLTTINRGTDAFFGQALGPFSPRLNLNVNLGGGNDDVTISNARLGDVTILTNDPSGQGANDADVVKLDRVNTAGSVTINTGAGNDVVNVFGSTIGNGTGVDNLSITAGLAAAPGSTDIDGVFLGTSTVFDKTTVVTGAGADYVSVQNSNLGNAEFDAVVIDAGAGNDVVELGMPNRPGQISGPVKLGGSLSILGDSFANSAAESGNDIIRMNDVSSAFDMGANLWKGNDRLEVSNLQARYMAFHGDQGDDVMTMTNIEARETVFALMGENNDSLSIIGAKARRMELDGGGGFDRLEKGQISSFPSMLEIKWEVINGKQVQSKGGMTNLGALATLALQPTR